MIERFWHWIDSRSVVRRIVLFTTLWMTWGAFKWAALFAVTSTLPGLDRAAVIAAVVGPISALQGYVFSAYTSGRSNAVAVRTYQPPPSSAAPIAEYSEFPRPPSGAL